MRAPSSTGLLRTRQPHGVASAAASRCRVVPVPAAVGRPITSADRARQRARTACAAASGHEDGTSTSASSAPGSVTTSATTEQTEVVAATAAAAETAASSSSSAVISSNGATKAAATSSAAAATSVDLELKYEEPSGMDKFWTSFKLAFALPWRRFKKGSVLVLKLEGEISDQAKGRFNPGTSVPQICAVLQKAALDPRVSGIALEVGPLAVGYAKLQEIRRYMMYFRKCGKFSMAYMKQGGEKEYYLASACEEVYAPPTASLSLRGFTVGGTFLRGVLDKVGVEPQVRRIGAYKSAGDQLLRTSMAPEQREQLTSLLDATYEDWTATIAQARGKTVQQVQELLDAGLYDAKDLHKGGWLDGLKYEDELIDDLKKRADTPTDKPLKKVGLRKLAAVRPSSYRAMKGGKKRIVVLRTAGAILGKASGTGGSITPDQLIPKLRALAQDKGCAGVVLRVDSPGGDALASDLMWREVKKLGEKKPVIASMADVAGSGGYYIAMAAHKIVAEPLTITGSIGVVTGKFNLSELYTKVGYAKELISRGKFAELLADNRPFSPDEERLFDESAQNAYESFRDKAAASRGMTPEQMQPWAQGRVYSGKRALEIGLVDALGGVHAAVQLVKAAAEIPADERVTVVEAGRAAASPLALIRGASVLASQLAAVLAKGGAGVTSAPSATALLGLLMAPALTSSSASMSTSAVGAGLGSELGSVITETLASVHAAGVASSLGSEAAQAVVAANVVGGLGSPLGLSYSADPQSLVVTATGTQAALAATQQQGASASAAAGQGEYGLFADDDFIVL